MILPRKGPRYSAQSKIMENWELRVPGAEPALIVYRGPLLLAFDPVFNAVDPDAVPVFDAKTLHPEIATTNRAIQPWILVKVKALNGQEMELCGFATAGAYGNSYRSWPPIRGLDLIVFDLRKPIWNNRPQ